MESVLMTHPEETVPFLVRDFDLLDKNGTILSEIRSNHSCRYEHTFDNALTTTKLILRIHATHGIPAAIFRVRVF